MTLRPVDGIDLPESHPWPSKQAYQCSECDGICFPAVLPNVCPYCGEKASEETVRVYWGCTTFGCELGFSDDPQPVLPRGWKFCPECGGELAAITRRESPQSAP